MAQHIERCTYISLMYISPHFLIGNAIFCDTNLRLYDVDIELQPDFEAYGLSAGALCHFWPNRKVCVFSGICFTLQLQQFPEH